MNLGSEAGALRKMVSRAACPERPVGLRGLPDARWGPAGKQGFDGTGRAAAQRKRRPASVLCQAFTWDFEVSSLFIFKTTEGYEKCFTFYEGENLG